MSTFFPGKLANEIGPTRLFNENVKNADERFLAAGNFTGCETIEVLKKAAYDYRKKMEIDENMFTACRIYRSVYRQLDKESKVIRGNCQILKKENDTIYFCSLFSVSRICSDDG